MSVERIKMPIGNNRVVDPTIIPIEIPEGATLALDGIDYNFDANGNAIDKDSKVIKTKDELQTILKEHPEYLKPKVVAADAANAADGDAANADDVFVEGADVELDGVSYKINKDGAAVDNTGKIIKTKDELKALYNANKGPETVDYIKEIQTRTNIVLTDDKGEPVAYENTVEGLSQYAIDAFDTGKRTGAKEAQDQLFSQYPILNDILLHLQLNNGDIKNFNAEPNYSAIQLVETNTDQLESVYIMAQVKRGVPEPEAKAMAKYLKDDGKILEFAKSGLKFLIDNKTAEDNAKTARVNQLRADQEEQDARYWKAIDTSLKSRKIKISDEEFTIPEVIRVKTADGKYETKTPTDFVKYMTEPRTFTINNEVITATQHEVDEYNEHSARTPDHDIFDAYRRFVKYDDTQLIKAKLRNERAANVIKLITKNASGTGGSSSSAPGGKIVLPIKSAKK